MTEQPKKRGFALLSPERRREIASMGGKSVKPENRAYARDPDLAKWAAKKGGTAPHKSRGGNPYEGGIFELWTGRMEATLHRFARNGKTLVEARAEIKSQMSIPAFRAKCKKRGIVFVRTRPLPKPEPKKRKPQKAVGL